MSEEIVNESASEEMVSTEDEGHGETEEQVHDDTNEDVEETEDSVEVEEQSEEEPVSEVDEMSRMYKTIVNGIEQEISVADLIKNHQLKEASYKKFQEAAEKEKQVEAFKQAISENPIDVMKQVGMDEQMIKEYIFKEASRLLDEDEMPEEERRLKALEEENRRFKEQEEQRLKQEEERLYQESVEREMKSYEEQFMKALESESIPSSPDAIRDMATIMAQALEYGVDMSIEDAASYYKEQQNQRLSSMLGGLSGEQLSSYLPKEAADKIRQNDIKKLKNPAPKKSLPKSEPTKKQPKQSMADFFDSLGKS